MTMDEHAEWHPSCTSVRSDAGYGGRVDVEALRQGEQVTYRDSEGELLRARIEDVPRDELGYCGYVDLSVSWVDDADWPKDWRCPECGGTDFEGVHLPSATDLRSPKTAK